MKKFYMLAALAAMAMGANAQTIIFTMGDKTLTPGETVVFNDMHKTADYGDDGYDYMYDPKLYFTASQAGNVDGTVICTTGQDVQFCLGGSCERNPKIIKTGVKVPANEPQNTQFEFGGSTYSADELPPKDVKVDITMQYTGKPETAVSLHFEFNKDLSSVTMVQDDVKIVATPGEVRYNTAEKAVLNLYTMGGQLAAKATVHGNGAINTSNLPKGVYIYTLGNKSGKLIVK